MIRRLLATLAITLVAADATAQPCAPDSPRWRLRGPVDEVATWPRHVRHAVACFDPVDGVLLLVAMSAAGDRTELWEWNGFRWRTLEPQDGVTPPPLADAAATFHEATGRVILFGGTLPSGLDSNRTWLWNGAFWDEPSFPDPPPAPLHAAAFAYVRPLEVAVLFGGMRDGSLVDQTWTWGLGGGWRLRGRGPAAQDARGRFTGLPGQGVAVLCDATAPDASLRGTWHFGEQGWLRMSDAEPPTSAPGRISPVEHDPHARSLARFTLPAEGEPLQRWTWSGLSATWELDGTMDTSFAATLLDVTTASDARRKRIVLMGRRGPDAPLELWEHDRMPGGLAVARPVLSYGLNSNAQVLAAGDGPLTFQWLRDGVALEDDATFEGTQSPSLAIDGGRARCGGFRLSCRVCGPCGCVESDAVSFDYPFLADFNVDGGVDGLDIEAFVTAWEASEPAADANCDGGVDGADVESFFRCWESGCG